MIPVEEARLYATGRPTSFLRWCARSSNVCVEESVRRPGSRPSGAASQPLNNGVRKEETRPAIGAFRSRQLAQHNAAGDRRTLCVRPTDPSSHAPSTPVRFHTPGQGREYIAAVLGSRIAVRNQPVPEPAVGLGRQCAFDVWEEMRRICIKR